MQQGDEAGDRLRLGLAGRSLAGVLVVARYPSGAHRSGKFRLRSTWRPFVRVPAGCAVRVIDSTSQRSIPGGSGTSAVARPRRRRPARRRGSRRSPARPCRRACRARWPSVGGLRRSGRTRPPGRGRAPAASSAPPTSWCARSSGSACGRGRAAEDGAASAPRRGACPPSTVEPSTGTTDGSDPRRTRHGQQRSERGASTRSRRRPVTSSPSALAMISATTSDLASA